MIVLIWIKNEYIYKIGKSNMNICYWNIHKNNETQNNQFDEFLLKMLVDKSVDLFCVSEFDAFNEKVILDNDYELVDKANCDKVKCYKKRGTQFVQTRIDDRYAIIEDKSKKILIVCLHAYDAFNYGDDKRLLCMQDIKMNVNEIVKNEPDTSVFIIGDFNCMPYDTPVINEDVFNCVLYRDLLYTRAGSNERYYNPMLLLLSETEKIYGSYYNDSIRNKNLRWYLLDQLMVNKNADKIINYDSIEIIAEIQKNSLLKNNKPDSVNYSDHLPLFFEIKED